MKQKDTIPGTVRSVHKGSCKVEIDNGLIITAHLSGRMMHNKVYCVIGDRVEIELTPYDLGRGRIVWRSAKG